MKTGIFTFLFLFYLHGYCTPKITEFKLLESGISIDVSKKIEIDYNYNFIQIIFEDAQKHPNTEFLVKLEGLKGYTGDNWINIDNQNQMVYSNLLGGEYTFNVKNINTGNVTLIKFTIKPVYWQTWWFVPVVILLTCTILGIIIYLFFLYKLHQQHKTQSIRNQIASDLHDEVGSNLSSISIFIEVLKKKIKKESPELLAIIDRISLNSEESVSLMRETVWSINPENDSSDKLFERMRSHGKEILIARNIDFSVKNELENRKIGFTMQQSRNIYLIFKEAINNIVKHSKAKNAALNIRINNNDLIINIIDDGIGFEKNEIYEGNGLKNYISRGIANNLIVYIDSEPNKGTNIQISTSL